MKLMRWLVMVLFVASVAAAFVGWNKVEQLRSDNDMLKAQNQSLTEHNAEATRKQTQERDQELQKLRTQTQEVQKLRNEVSQLRAGAKDVERLRAENQQLRAAAGASLATATPAPAVKSGASDQFPRENWAFSGYATPEAALVSAVWAMREGSPKTYLESLSPEEQVRMAKSWQNKSEAEIAAKHQQDAASITGVRILDRQTVSADEVLMDVYVEGAGRMEKVSMKRVGNDWKFGGNVKNQAK